MRVTSSSSLVVVFALCLLGWGATTATAVTSLGTGTGALLGGDLTDPQDNIDDDVPGNPPFFGSNFNFVNATATSENFFTPGGGNEGALDVFDNKVDSGEAKWCCDGPPQSVAVQFARAVMLTHFTIAAGNDEEQRDPDVWRIQGSNDGISWTTIFEYNNDGTSPFSQRLEVLRYDAGTDFDPPEFFRWFRYRVSSVVDGNEHQINEIEYFGLSVAATAPAIETRWLAALVVLMALIALRRMPRRKARREV
jgi:hypothetical protein